MQGATEPLDQEPEGISTPKEPPQAKQNSRKAIATLRRELTDKDMTNPAAYKLLLDEVDRLELQVAVLDEFRAKFHEANLRAAVYDQRLKNRHGDEIIFAVCTTLAGAGLGFAPTIWPQDNSTGSIILVAAGVLLACAIVSKAKKA